MLVTVAKFLFAYEAHNLASRLRAEGVFALSQYQGLTYADWKYTAAVGGFRVWVAASDLEAARGVIQRCLDGEFRRELEQEFGSLDEVACPSCGSLEFSSRSNRVHVSLVALISFLGIAVTARPVICRCDNCKTWWQDC